MGTFFSRRDGTRPTQVMAPPRVAHFYLNLAEQKLYCLNETARDCIREGAGRSAAADLGAAQPLKTLDGAVVTSADLPLLRCRREGTPQEVAFVLEKKGSLPQTLTWSVAPLSNSDGGMAGLTAALVVSSPEPDWEELAGLAHDLRTPLAVSRSLVGAGPGDDAGPCRGGSGCWSSLRTAADRAMVISHDLLEWCKTRPRSVRGPAPPGCFPWCLLEPLLGVACRRPDDRRPEKRHHPGSRSPRRPRGGGPHRLDAPGPAARQPAQ